MEILSVPSSCVYRYLQARLLRLTIYVNELKDYNSRLQHIYSVEFNIQSTNADRNINIAVKVDGDACLIVQNDFLNRNMPTTKAPSHLPFLGYSTFSQYLDTGSGYVEDGVAYDNLEQMNACQKYQLFTRGFYIETIAEKVNLEITIHSENLREPQIIHQQIPFSGTDG